jgi:hypothetical protein
MCIECVHEVHFTDEYLRNAFLSNACEALTPSTVLRSDSGTWEQGGVWMPDAPRPALPSPPVPPAAAVARAPGRAGAVLAG